MCVEMGILESMNLQHFLYIHKIPDSLHEELVECEYLFMYSHVN